MWGTWGFHPYCTQCDQLESEGKKGRGVIFFLQQLLHEASPLSSIGETEMLGIPGQSQGSCSLCRKKAGGIHPQGWVRNRAAWPET